MMDVRKAIREDVPVLTNIMITSFRSAFADFVSAETMEQCTNEENCLNMMKHIYETGNMNIYVALLNGVPSGELFWADGAEEENSAEIVALHSLPETKGSGVGHAMLIKALTDMKKRGKQGVYLWAFEENFRARRFYEKHGLLADGNKRVSEFDGAVEVRYFMKWKGEGEDGAT